MRTTLLALCVSLALGAAGCRSTQPVSRQMDDNMITAQVNAKLATDPHVSVRNVSVQTDEGVVTLTGRVENDDARSGAERAAMQVDGVRQVRNLIKVGDLTPESTWR